MTESEIDEYAKLLKIELAPCETLQDKIDMICRRRERCAVITVLGVDLEIPIKRVHDKRITDILGSRNMNDEDTYRAMELLLGEHQTRILVDACTDDDGTIDSDALGLAFVKVLTSDSLKNF